VEGSGYSLARTEKNLERPQAIRYHDQNLSQYFRSIRQKFYRLANLLDDYDTSQETHLENYERLRVGVYTSSLTSRRIDVYNCGHDIAL
jgi:hypothetical protein